MSRREVVRGTVTKIDTKTSEVSVKTDDGRQMTFAVAPSTAQRLKKGDQIQVGLEVTVTRPGRPE